MRRNATLLAAAIIIQIMTINLAFPGSVSAREPEKTPVRFTSERSYEDYAGRLYEIMGVTMAPAAVDTFHIVRYDFETADWQRWTAVDETAQKMIVMV